MFSASFSTKSLKVWSQHYSRCVTAANSAETLKRKGLHNLSNNKTDENVKLIAAWYIMWKYMDEKVEKMKWRKHTAAL